MKRIYLDHNATSRLRPEVREAWLNALDEVQGNPSSLHTSGRRARHLLDEARERTASALGVREDEVVFTSGGTESNNLALLGVLRPLDRATGLLTTAVEHSSVLEPARQLAREGRPVEFAPVTALGLVDLDSLRERIAAFPCGLVSVMAANNEVGVRMPLSEVSSLLRNRRQRPLFHAVAVQALGRVPIELDAWGIDLASFAAHKVGGPLGIGILFRRAGVALQPLLFGGEQESALRPGTENVPAIVAASCAIDLAVRERASFAERASRLARALWEELGVHSNDVRLLGPELTSDARIPGTLNLVATSLDGKVLVTRLDLAGLEVSGGSACASGSLEPSHVLLAMGLDEREARAGLRLSIGRETTLAEVRQAVDILRRTLGRERATRADDTSS